jgi:GT2 family glycosyltransferase
MEVDNQNHCQDTLVSGSFRESFSIIVPTFRRPTLLAACLRALAQLDYPRELYEVLVVNDGTENLPREVVEAFATQIDVKLVSQQHGGPAKARNTGTELAKGQYLAFTDDDCAPHKSWLSAFARYLVTMPRAMLGGLTINALTDNAYSSASQMLSDYLRTYIGKEGRGSFFFPSNNMCLPAGLFKSIGGFKATFRTAEDRELCDRWQHSGYRLAYVPDALVYHSHSLEFSSFWRQHFEYGRGALGWRKAHFERTSEPIQFGDSKIKFYANMLRYPFSQDHGRRALLFSGLLTISQIAYLSGAIVQKARDR